ncbi:hypothetical protein NGA_0720900, partial [Nannochloropsis gaditana CCMP526]|uniref:uncharacterized protein n=1 Tax=Nannochloropsis gaditana (strain CCMP526) TaxID=1093141 RepID=UPI00029F4F17
GRKRARKIVTQFHKVNDALAILEEDANLNLVDKEAHRSRLQESLEALGGRAAYQSASQLSVSFHSTSKWVLARLQAMGIIRMQSAPSLSPSQPSQKPRLLEVGAITTTLLDCPAVQTTAIDLLSRHARIQQIDFFHLPQPPLSTFDVIVASMLINSLPTASARGDFLRRCHAYLEASKGYLFLILPSSCLTHSKYMTVGKFRSLVTTRVGFAVVEEKWTPKTVAFVLRASGKCDEGRLTAGREKVTSSSWAKKFDILL